MELIKIIKCPKNKINQNCININKFEDQTFNEIIDDDFNKYIPKIDDDEGDKLNLKNLEALSNISSNHFRNNRVIKHYIYLTTKYSSNN